MNLLELIENCPESDEPYEYFTEIYEFGENALKRKRATSGGTRKKKVKREPKEKIVIPPHKLPADKVYVSVEEDSSDVLTRQCCLCPDYENREDLLKTEKKGLYAHKDCAMAIPGMTFRSLFSQLLTP